MALSGNPLGLEFFSNGGFGSPIYSGPTDIGISGISIPSISSSDLGAINNQVLGMGGYSPTGKTGGGFFGDMNGMGKVSSVLGGLNAIGNLWGGFQAMSLAKKQFNYMKDITETNLANQIQSYNTALADRSRSRAFTEGQSAEEAQSYIDENSLRRRRG